MELTATLTSDRFNNSLFEVLVKKAEGEVIKRTLPLSDFINLIANNVVIKEEEVAMIETPIPKGCFKLRVGERPEDFDAAFFLPEEVIGAKILGNPMRFLQPNRVVFISHRKKEGTSFDSTSLYVFAVKDAEITDKTSLFWYPLGHVGQNGSVCSGSSGTKINSILDSHKYFDSFFGAESSGHYYSSGKTIKENMSYGEMMETLSNLNKFPYDEWLVPASPNNVKAAWNNFIK